jgi:hypothetical protein
MELATVNKFYGHCALVRAAGGLPRTLPLPFAIQHGWLASPVLATHIELLTGLPAVWTWTPAYAEEFGRFGARTFVGGAPFLYAAARTPRAVRDADRRGTIVFPLHGTPDIRVHAQYDEYVDQLRSLPAEHHPLLVCLHPHALGSELEHRLRAAGIAITSNGPVLSRGYLTTFIATASRFRYACANGPGPALLYASMLGLHAFVHGAAFRLENVSDHRHPLGDHPTDTPRIRELRRVFTLDVPIEDQQAVARAQLGADHVLSRQEIRRRFWQAYRRLRPAPLLRAIGERARRRVGLV